MLFKTYKLNKRVNSTKLPTAEDLLISGEVSFKGETSLKTPVILMACGEEHMPYALISNYAELKGNYYWITDVVQTSKSHVEFYCELDVLGTYRKEILETRTFVNYDTTPNTEIPDGRLSRNTSQIVDYNEAPFPAPIGDVGVYVLTTAGKDRTAIYVIDRGRLVELLKNVSNWTDELMDLYPNPDDVSNIGEVLKWNTEVVSIFFKQMVSSGSAINNIKSCIWLPLAIGGTGDFKEIWLGNFQTGVNGYEVTTLIKRYTVNVTIPWQYGDWRRRSPYTEVYLYIPFIGEMHYSSDNLIGIDSLKIEFSINLVSGTMAVLVYGGQSILGMYNANIACQIPIGTTVTNPITAASNMITIGTGIASGLISTKMKGAGKMVSAVMGISQTAQGTLQLANTLIPNPTTVGGSSGGAGFGLLENIRCVTISHGTSVEPNSVNNVIGTPAMGVKLLGELTGYVETEGASVSAVADVKILDKVNALLDGGVYIE